MEICNQRVYTCKDPAHVDPYSPQPTTTSKVTSTTAQLQPSWLQSKFRHYFTKDERGAKQANGEIKFAQEASEMSKFKSEVYRQLQAFPEYEWCFPKPSSSHTTSRSLDLGAGFLQERVCLDSICLKDENKEETHGSAL